MPFCIWGFVSSAGSFDPPEELDDEELDGLARLLGLKSSPEIAPESRSSSSSPPDFLLFGVLDDSLVRVDDLVEVDRLLDFFLAALRVGLLGAAFAGVGASPLSGC